MIRCHMPTVFTRLIIRHIEHVQIVSPGEAAAMACRYTHIIAELKIIISVGISPVSSHKTLPSAAFQERDFSAALA